MLSSSRVKSGIFITLFCFMHILCMQHCAAQDTVSQRVYFELGGSSGLASFNYEKDFYQHDWLCLGWSVGLSGFPIDKNNGIVFVIPTLLHCEIGAQPSKLEFGIGQALSVTTKASGFSMLTPFVGYRYHNPQSRWMYRVTYTPIVSYLLQFQYQHWMGLSVGYVW